MNEMLKEFLQLEIEQYLSIRDLLLAANDE